MSIYSNKVRELRDKAEDKFEAVFNDALAAAIREGFELRKSAYGNRKKSIALSEYDLKKLRCPYCRREVAIEVRAWFEKQKKILRILTFTECSYCDKEWLLAGSGRYPVGYYPSQIKHGH